MAAAGAGLHTAGEKRARTERDSISRDAWEERVRAARQVAWEEAREAADVMMDHECPAEWDPVVWIRIMDLATKIAVFWSASVRKIYGVAPNHRWSPNTWGRIKHGQPLWLTILADRNICAFWGTAEGCKHVTCNFDHVCILCGEHHAALQKANDDGAVAFPASLGALDIDADAPHTHNVCRGDMRYVCPIAAKLADAGLPVLDSAAMMRIALGRIMYSAEWPAPFPSGFRDWCSHSDRRHTLNPVFLRERT